MAEDKLHTGVWVRQLLMGKRKVRISYLPDGLGPAQSTIRKFDEGEKSTWIELLGDPQDVDVDKGITLLRFNEANNRCYATWLPASGQQEKIHNIYERPEPEPGEGEGGAEYRKCMSDNAGKSFIEANAICLSQWLV